VGASTVGLFCLFTMSFASIVGVFCHDKRGLFRHDRWAPSGLPTGQRSVTTPTSSRGTILFLQFFFAFKEFFFPYMLASAL
jgi:hypothetical protein